MDFHQPDELRLSVEQYAPTPQISSPDHRLPCPHDALRSQAQALLNEMERLDVAFANDLARLRETYDVKKAALQAQLRACLDRQRATPAV